MHEPVPSTTDYNSPEYWANQGLDLLSGLKDLKQTERAEAGRIASGLYNDLSTMYAPVIQNSDRVDWTLHDELVSGHDLRVAVREEVDHSLGLEGLSERHHRTQQQLDEVIEVEASLDHPVSVPVNAWLDRNIAIQVEPGEERHQVFIAVEEFRARSQLRRLDRQSLSQLPTAIQPAAEKYLANIEQGNANDIANGAGLTETARNAWTEEHDSQPDGDANFLPFWFAVRTPGFVDSRLKELISQLPQDQVDPELANFAEAIGKKAYELYQSIQSRLPNRPLSHSSIVFLSKVAGREVLSEKIFQAKVAKGCDSGSIIEKSDLNGKLELHQLMERLPGGDQSLVREAKSWGDRQNAAISFPGEYEKRQSAERELLQHLISRGVLQAGAEMIPDSLVRNKKYIAQKLLEI